MRIGILGGTFDPIHKGHLALAQAACEQLSLDRMLFVPAFQHPLKSNEAITATPEDRLALVASAVRDKSKFEVSDVEMKRKGISYTVDTLRELRKQYPEPNELFFITGGDWGKNLEEWKEIKTIFSLAQFVVAKRPGFDLGRLPTEVRPLDFVPLDISSTEIRRQIREGKSVKHFVPKSVLRYLEVHQLYQT